MVLRLLPLVLIVALAASAAAQTSGQPGQSRRGAPQSAVVKEGVGHFDKAFYDLTPKGRHAEAAVLFDRAIAAFDRELAANPASSDAHVYLARIYAMRKDFRKAASHYDKLAELEPFNVDACVFAAVEYMNADDPAEARRRLVGAKDRTLDTEVLARLDEYIAKVDALKR
jgi:tetratricopeptide (TPR) repeat protein